MRDYKKEIAAYLDKIKERDRHSIDRVLEDVKSSKYVCVFGIGAISYPIISALKALSDIRIDFLCDNDKAKWGKYYHGDLLCISPDELEKYTEEVAILITTQHYKDIYAQLLGKGFKRIFVTTEYRLLNNDFFKKSENIENVKNCALRLVDILEDEKSMEILQTLIVNWFDFSIDGVGYRGIYSDDQYYPEGIIKLGSNEAFVDGGAYNGDTLLEFIEKTAGKFHSAAAFELDRQNFREMQNNVNRLDPTLKKKISLYNLGILDKETEIGYEAGGSGKQSTFINVIGNTSKTGETVRLSDILKDRKVTFIKMDIEGAERNALIGAEDLIRDQKPKLAICVYHKLEHLWEIPFYLKKLVPEYRIFLRHHTNLEYETVCYAVL